MYIQWKLKKQWNSRRLHLTILSRFGFYCTVYSVQCTVYSVQSTVYSAQCTVYIPHPGLREHYGRRMLLEREESRIQEPLQFNQACFIQIKFSKISKILFYFFFNRKKKFFSLFYRFVLSYLSFVLFALCIVILFGCFKFLFFYFVFLFTFFYNLWLIKMI